MIMMVMMRDKFHSSPGWLGTYYVDQASFVFKMVLLPLLPECFNHGYVSLGRVRFPCPRFSKLIIFLVQYILFIVSPASRTRLG